MLEKLRVGSGFDVHAFVSGKPLVLGGVVVPHEKGLEGHSDADVLSHAVIDSILGALAAGDLGTYFSSSDPQWRGARSLEFFKKVNLLLQERGGKILSIDTTLIAQEPRLSPYTDEMRKNIANALDLSLDRISIKSSTTDHLGFTGRAEGIATQAVCLLVVDDDK